MYGDTTDDTGERATASRGRPTAGARRTTMGDRTATETDDWSGSNAGGNWT